MQSLLLKHHKITGKILWFIENLVLITGLIAASYVLYLIFEPFKNTYLNLTSPTGGDYYNGLTYVVHFAKHLPNPATGWLNFWHEGIPIIGGYPTIPFYLITILFHHLEAASAMEIFAIYSHLAFILASLLLFWQITRSSTVAFIFALIILFTKATYYQLFGEGLVAASSSQWLMPLSLFFTYRYLYSQKNRDLIASSLTTGVAIIFHPAMSFLTAFLPNLILITIFKIPQNKKIKEKISAIFFFVLISFLVGSTTIYSTLLQTFNGAGSGPCNSPQCWGVYPDHIELWLNAFAPTLAVFMLLIATCLKLVNKQKVKITIVIASAIAALVVILYPLAAYAHLINPFASAIFPRRIFWAINLLLLVIAANSFRLISEFLTKKFSWTIPTAVLLIIIFSYEQYSQLINPANILNTTNPGTIPANVDKYIVPKYKSEEITKLVPDWVDNFGKTETNYRFDSFNQQVNHWWNIPFVTPATRGYSNSPTDVHATWLYYLQVGTGENNPNDDPELIKNRTLFLLDHYAIGIYDDSARSQTQGKLGYDKSILDNPEIVTKHQAVRELNFYEISKRIVSPIVSPTNTTPVLVVGDENAYESFVRALSYTGLTSKSILPVKASENLGNLSNNQLEQFPVLVLYQFTGQNWDKLATYVKNGGKIFVETGSLEENLPKNLQEFSPATSISKIRVEDAWQPRIPNQSSLTDNIDLQKFSPFKYQDGPWKISVYRQSNLNKNTTALLTYQNDIILAQTKFGRGEVIFSGINLPFHIVDNRNFEESKLFKNIMLELIGETKQEEPSFKIQRDFPEKITITGSNFNGVYFKENYNPGWRATGNGNQDLKVYSAGLGFMYIPLLKSNPSDNLQINLEFEGNLTTWFLQLITAISISASILFFISPKLFYFILRKALFIPAKIKNLIFPRAKNLIQKSLEDE